MISDKRKILNHINLNQKKHEMMIDLDATPTYVRFLQCKNDCIAGS